MEGTRAAISSFDFQLIHAAVQWTAASPARTAVVYVAAELLIFLLPLIVLYLWELPSRERTDRYGPKKAAVMAMLSVTLGLAAKTMLAFVLFRARPFITHPELASLQFHVDANSFPSSHAMISFAVACSLFWSGYRKLGYWLIGLAVVISLARVFSGVHYPSDVLAGALVGIGGAWYLHREASSLRRYLPNK